MTTPVTLPAVPHTAPEVDFRCQKTCTCICPAGSLQGENCAAAGWEGEEHTMGFLVQEGA